MTSSRALRKTFNFLNSSKVNFNSIKNFVWNKFRETGGDNDGYHIGLKFRAVKRYPGHVVVTGDEKNFREKISVPFGLADPCQ